MCQEPRREDLQQSVAPLLDSPVPPERMHDNGWYKPVHMVEERFTRDTRVGNIKRSEAG